MMDATQYSTDDTWLKADDLKGRTVELEITDVEVVTFGSDEAKDHKLGLFFKGREKGIVSNKTNTKRIIEAFGAETAGWKGKKIRASQNHTPLGVGFTLMPVVETPGGNDFDDEIPF